MRFALVVLFTLGFLLVAFAQVGTTTRISYSSGGVEGNGPSYAPSISDDGRYVVFDSSASNLVGNDFNGASDIFLRDRQQGTTVRISLSSLGIEGNSDSTRPRISGDGRFITYESFSNNLVPNDTNNSYDIFLFDRVNSLTKRISVQIGGLQANSNSYRPCITTNGRYTAYESFASDLVPNDTNGVEDVFVYDRITQETLRVSTSSIGTQANGPSFDASISSSGDAVAYASFADNLVDSDTTSVSDIFVSELFTGETTMVSLNSLSQQADNDCYAPSISGNSRYVAFESYAANLVPDLDPGFSNIFVRDRLDEQTTLASPGDEGVTADDSSYSPAVSSDGRYVAFSSYATNLIPNDLNGFPDVFIRDRQEAVTTRVSHATSSFQANGESFRPAITPDAVYVAFDSFASDIDPQDLNVSSDVFIHQFLTSTASVVITGTVLPGNFYQGSLPSSILVSFRNAANTEVATANATYNPTTHAFSVTAPPQVSGPYRISFKLGFWLRKTLPNPTQPAHAYISWNFGSVTLTVGDIDNDNEVTNADYAIWASQNGSSVSPGTGADLDGDGEITNADYALWASTNGSSGDQ